MVRIVLRLLGPGDPDFGDVVADLQDLSRTATSADHRSVRRTLESTSDAILKRIERSLQSEFASISDNNLEAAVQALQDTLNDGLTQGALGLVIDTGFDPQELERQLRISTRRDYREYLLDTAAREAYDFLLRDAAAAICQLASRLKDFTPQTLIRLLQDSRHQLQFLSKVDESLSALLTRAAAQETATQQHFIDFELAYLRSVARTHDRLELYGLNMEWTVRNYNLTTAYLSLQASNAFIHDGPKDIGACLAPDRCVVIQGIAGSGKTTILQWFAVNAARKRLPSELAKYNGSIPVIAKLRRYEGELPTIAELVAQTAATPLSTIPSGWIDDAIERGRFVFLIDGLDEVPKARQSRTIEWIRSLAANHGRCRVILTARPSAKDLIGELNRRTPDDSNHGAWFTTLELLSMSKEQIVRFVAHWHKAVYEDDLETDGALWEQSARRASNTILTSRGHRQLASSPLLCAVMCALFHVRSSTLPATRIETYRVALDLLLQNRDSAREISTSLDVKIDLRAKYALVGRIAEWLILNELSEVEKERLLPIVSRGCEVLGLPDDVSAQVVLDYLVDRSGLLRDVGAGVVDFMHRTFMEFLAAKELMDNDLVEALLENALKPTWNEVLVLAGAHGIRRQHEALLTGLLDRGRRASGDDRLLYTTTCAGCVETMSEVSGPLRQDIAALLTEVVPPHSTDVAHALARAGGLVLPALRNAFSSSDDMTASTVAACIVCLADVGGVAALQVLADVPMPVRIHHLPDLIRVWSDFDLEYFYEFVLADLVPNSPTVVVVNQIDQLERLRGWTPDFQLHASISLPPANCIERVAESNLVALSISEASLLWDDSASQDDLYKIDRLLEIPTLQELRLHGLRDLHNGTRRTERASALRRIELEFYGGRLDLRAFANLSSLDSLAVVGADEVAWLEGLSSCADLRELGFEDIKRSVEFRRTSISTLNLRILDTHEDFDAGLVVQSCPLAVDIVLARVAGLEDLDCIRSIENLNSLLVVDCLDLANVDGAIESMPMAQCRFEGSFSIRKSSVVEGMVLAGIDVEMEGVGDDGPLWPVTSDSQTDEIPGVYVRFWETEDGDRDYYDPDDFGEIDQHFDNEGLTVYESLGEMERSSKRAIRDTHFDPSNDIDDGDV